MAQAARLLSPLAEAIVRYVLAAEKIHGDDTPIRVLGGAGAEARTGLLWVDVRDDRPAATQRRRRCGSWPATIFLELLSCLTKERYSAKLSSWIPFF